MNIRGKVTKTEWILVLMAACFVLTLPLLHADRSAAAGVTVVTEGARQERAAVVDVNTADSAALQTLPGIGEVLAQRILDRRSADGPFTAVEELLEVKGIGESTLEAIRPYITLGTEEK